MSFQWSVVVPVINEMARLSVFVNQLREKFSQAEIIVVDGGSHDGTWQWLHEQKDLKTYQTIANRGGQMAFGAEQATRPYLLFVHADSWLPEDPVSEMEGLLNQSDNCAGAFRFAANHSAWRYRLMEFFVNTRCSLLQMPYGDQGLFIAREIYHQVGGFSNLPLMEDVDLCRRLKKRGGISLTRAAMKTSVRRMEARGFCRSWVLNFALVTLFHCRVDPYWLKKKYE